MSTESQTHCIPARNRVEVKTDWFEQKLAFVCQRCGKKWLPENDTPKCDSPPVQQPA